MYRKAVSGQTDSPNADSPPAVVVATIDDETISPVTVQFFRRALAAAQSRNAECLVLKLDTPGGLMTFARAIVKDFHYATSQLCQTTLRSVLGQAELDELLSERDKINRQLQEVIDQRVPR